MNRIGILIMEYTETAKLRIIYIEIMNMINPFALDSV